MRSFSTVAAALLLVACSGASSDTAMDAGVDVFLPPGPPGARDAGFDAGVTDGGSHEDAGLFDAGTDEDAGVTDAGTDEDAGVTDAGTDEDAGVTDAGTDEDAGVFDAGTDEDAGVFDAGTDEDAGVFDAGMSSGLDCTFNSDCPLAERCECADFACTCQIGQRGTGVAGVDPCIDGNDCESSLCVEGNGGIYFCSGECTSAAQCGPNLPLCANIAFIGQVCIRDPNP